MTVSVITCFFDHGHNVILESILKFVFIYFLFGTDIQQFSDQRDGPHDGGHDCGHLPQVSQRFLQPVHAFARHVCVVHPAHQPGGGAGPARQHTRLPHA